MAAKTAHRPAHKSVIITHACELESGSADGLTILFRLLTRENNNEQKQKTDNLYKPK